MRMEAETKDGKSEPQEEPQNEAQKTPLSKLRDLRPEKDPIGAGRNLPGGSASAARSVR